MEYVMILNELILLPLTNHWLMLFLATTQKSYYTQTTSSGFGKINVSRAEKGRMPGRLHRSSRHDNIITVAAVPLHATHPKHKRQSLNVYHSVMTQYKLVSQHHTIRWDSKQFIVIKQRSRNCYFFNNYTCTKHKTVFINKINILAKMQSLPQHIYKKNWHHNINHTPGTSYFLSALSIRSPDLLEKPQWCDIYTHHKSLKSLPTNVLHTWPLSKSQLQLLSVLLL